MKKLTLFAIFLCLLIVPLFGCYYEEDPVEIDPYEIYEGAERSRIGNTPVSILDDYVMIDKFEIGRLLNDLYAYGFMDGYNAGSNGVWDDATEYYTTEFDYEYLFENYCEWSEY